MKKPFFSCVIPVKGSRPFLTDALASLRAQGLDDDLEIILQDADVEPDLGQSDALNKGFAKARGTWLFWLNADDVLLPDALAQVRSFLARKGSAAEKIEWIAGNEFFIDADGKTVGCSVGNGWHDWLYRHAVPHVNGPSAFFRRELFARVGAFDVDLHYCMDWDLWIRFRNAGAHFDRLPKFLWAQRRWSGSKTQRDLTAEEQAVQQREISAMLRKNGFTITASGLFILHVWRLLSGCYLKERLCVR
jgi:glycosyltransferase involved in cell wall biosynthesis